jgi:hypothetical protein
MRDLQVEVFFGFVLIVIAGVLLADNKPVIGGIILMWAGIMLAVVQFVGFFR